MLAEQTVRNAADRVCLAAQHLHRVIAEVHLEVAKLILPILQPTSSTFAQ
jgi:hypothetical protein